MTSDLLKQAVIYVTNAPFFWGSMGFTVAIAMFSGVLLYDGHLNQIKKGFVSVVSYASIIFWVTISRVLQTTSNPEFMNQTVHPEYAYAGAISLIFITLSWLLGILIGVLIFRYKYKGRHVDQF